MNLNWGPGGCESRLGRGACAFKLCGLAAVDLDWGLGACASKLGAWGL